MTDPPDFSRLPKKKVSSRNLVVLALLVVAVAIVAIAAILWRRHDGGTSAAHVPLTELLSAVDAMGPTGDPDARIVSARLDDAARRVVVEFADGHRVTSGYTTSSGADLVERFARAGVEVDVDAAEAADSLGARLVLSMIPLVLIGLLMVVGLRQYGSIVGRTGSIGRGGRPVDVPVTRFSDVIGADEAVADLREVVDYLRDPAPFERVGATPPTGILLVGPPGTGKTLTARAVAGEAGVPFFSVSGSDFVEMFVGVGAKRVRDLFAQANKHGRAVVFIDEVEGIGKARSSNGASGSSEEREGTLNALLVEMDGFNGSHVIVMAATNRPDMLDAALTRAGRFDRHVVLGAPDRRGRAALFEWYLGRKVVAPDVDLAATAERLAARTPGMTGADVGNIVNEAALVAAASAATAITVEHLEAGLERTVLGRARTSAVVSERSRRITAWHEAGHAIAAIVQDATPDPKRVSIIPRGQAGGVTWYGGDDESFMTRTQANAHLVVAFAGRAAEELLLDGDHTQGAESDIAHATRIATNMVCSWGMSELGLVRIETDQLLGEPAETVRAAVASICAAAMDAARALVREHRHLVERLAGDLLGLETVDEAGLAAYRVRAPRV